MTWTTMATRLSGDSLENTSGKTLLQQEQVFSALISKLSDIRKDRLPASPFDLKEVWTQVLDHLYVILVLAGFRE